MGQFFKFVFASVLGFFLAFILFILLFGVLVSGIVNSAKSKETVSSTPNTILHLQLDYPISERSEKDPFSEIPFFSTDRSPKLGLNDLLSAIKQGAKDANVKGIFLDFKDVGAGMASTEEIRNELIRFKKSGKFIIAYSEIYTEKAYYLASVADKIYLNPEGLLEFNGLSSQSVFIKGALEKLEIEPQIVKVGTFKSAIEPLILDKMSDANRKQVTSYLNSIYRNGLKNVGISRKIDADSLHSISNLLKVKTAEDAVIYKLADGLKYYDEVQTELKKRAGIDAEKDLKLTKIGSFFSPEANTATDRIAVIYANGDIQSGEGDDQSIGSDRIAAAIRKARKDSKIKAIVLRVNSPGGSALASDVIWREVSLTQKMKPVMVSMGDVAASGGYYISCSADSIFVQPNTITGSIGVFGVIPNAQKFFNNKLGITFDGVKTGEFADLGSTVRPFTEAERAIIQREVDRIYINFTQKVADGRKMSRANVDSIGQGRVWSGEEAIKIGLADKIGGIEDAIKAAAAKAGLKTYKTIGYPVQKDPFEEIMKNVSENTKAWFIKNEMGPDNEKFYQAFVKLMKMQGVQTRMPYDLEIR